MEFLKNVLTRTSSMHGLFNSISIRSLSNFTIITNFRRDGDSGQAQTCPGDIRPKDDCIFEAAGATDELSCFIGFAREFAVDNQHSYTDQLNRIQCILIDIGTAILNCPRPEWRTYLSKRHTKELEGWIDEYADQLPPLQNYIIPGGGKVCASLHVARTVCRRAERCVVPLVRKGDLDKETQIYLNRLSDFLLTISRYAAKVDLKGEDIYIQKKRKK